MSNIDAAGDWSEPRAASGDGANSPKQMASAAAQTVKQEAQSFAAQAKEKASGQIEQHKETATRTLGDFANAIRRAGDELSQSDQSVASRLVQQAADGLESFSRSVADKRPEELLDAVRDFGRRNPMAFVAGSVLVGLAVGRFLKASSEPRQDFTRMSATFESPEGGLPDVGGTGAMGMGGSAMGFTPETGSDVTAMGATSIGAPGDELGSGDVGVEGLTGDVSAEGLTGESSLGASQSSDLLGEDAGDIGETGAEDGDDTDRSRFGGGTTGI
jgi:hypothetical protein